MLILRAFLSCFFAFFLAVWGELTPPTSVVAAVTAKIANASFMRTLMAAITLCASLFVLMAAAFVRPELVVEVRYDHMEGERFRHTAQFNRWRPDRDPESCTYTQLEEPVSFDLASVLETGRP